MAQDCIFCSILAGDIPSTKVAESEHAYAFRDINPAAPVHVLVIPRRHEPDVPTLGREAPQDLLAVIDLAAEVARAEGVTDYRLVANTGPGAGQTVFHAHVHVLAGRQMHDL